MISVEPVDGVVPSDFANRMAKTVVNSLNNKESNLELVMAMLGEALLEVDNLGKRLSELEERNGS